MTNVQWNNTIQCLIMTNINVANNINNNNVLI